MHESKFIYIKNWESTQVVIGRSWERKIQFHENPFFIEYILSFEDISKNYLQIDCSKWFWWFLYIICHFFSRNYGYKVVLW